MLVMVTTIMAVMMVASATPAFAKPDPRQLTNPGTTAS
jgi:hypothetical protein